MRGRNLIWAWLLSSSARRKSVDELFFSPTLLSSGDDANLRFNSSHMCDMWIPLIVQWCNPLIRKITFPIIADYRGIIISPLFGPSNSQECVSLVNSRYEKRNMEIGWLRVYRWGFLHNCPSRRELISIWKMSIFSDLFSLAHSRALSWKWQHRAGRLPAMEYPIIKNGPAKSRFYG